MNSIEVVNQEDLTLLTSYLLGDKFSPGTSVKFVSTQTRFYKVNLRRFSYFKSSRDANLSISIADQYLLLTVGMISGQESKFGIFNLQDNSWLLRKYFAFEEIVASFIDTSSGTVFYSSYIYRHVSPPLHTVRATKLKNPDREINLEVISEKKLSSPRALFSLSLNRENHTIEFDTGYQTLVFDCEKVLSVV